MPALLAALLFALPFAPAPPVQRLDVDVVFVGGMVPSRMLTTAVTETTDLWEPYGVDIHTWDHADVTCNGQVRIAVRVVTGAPVGISPNSVGAIGFHDDEPVAVITLYLDVADEIVSSLARLEGEHNWPRAYRDTVMGRALGRALAHEIGHFLLRSKQHAPSGLMRAHQSIADFTSLDRAHLSLTPEEQAQIERTIASLSAGHTH